MIKRKVENQIGNWKFDFRTQIHLKLRSNEL